MNHIKIQTEVMKFLERKQWDTKIYPKLWMYARTSYMGEDYIALIYNQMQMFYIPKKKFFINKQLITELESQSFVNNLNSVLQQKDFGCELEFVKNIVGDSKIKRLTKLTDVFGVFNTYLDTKALSMYTKDPLSVKMYSRGSKELVAIFEGDIPIGCICPINKKE